MLSFIKYGGLRKWSVIAAVVLAAPFLASTARAASTEIQDGNSTLILNPTTPSAPLTSGWIVDGVNEYGGSPAGGEQFYYSIGNAAPQPITSLSNTSVFSAPGLFTAAYQGSGFTLSFNDTLTGGNPGSGSSGLVELVSINNTSASPLDFHLYEYTDLNVNGTASNDTLTISGGNTANQTDPLGADANVAVGTPNAYQIANDATIKNALTGSSAVTLTDNSTGPLFGNDSFAFEWDQDLAASTGSLLVSVTETVNGGQVVPLPSAAWAALPMLGLLAGVGIIRRARRKPAIA